MTTAQLAKVESRDIDWNPPKALLNRLEVVLPLIESGMPERHACNVARILWNDYCWLSKFHPSSRERIAKAKGELIKRHVENIAQSALPHKVTKTKTGVNKDGEVVFTTVEESEERDWKASDRILQIADPENFGPRTTGSSVNLTIANLLETTAQNIKSRNPDATIEFTDAEFTTESEPDPEEGS